MRRAKTTIVTQQKRALARPGLQPARGAAHSQWTWASPAHQDTTGIDRDIELVLDLVQETEGCSRANAKAEVLRRLSFAA